MRISREDARALRRQTAERIGCGTDELDTSPELVWLHARVLDGVAPLYFCETEDGDIGVWCGTMKEGEQALGRGNTPGDAVRAAMHAELRAAASPSCIPEGGT